MTDVLVIIPAYNESANIETVVGRLNSICPDYDYVVVSNDTSILAGGGRAIARRVAKRMPQGREFWTCR